MLFISKKYSNHDNHVIIAITCRNKIIVIPSIKDIAALVNNALNTASLGCVRVMLNPCGCV